ncbi:hypothetical protein Tco_0087653 [Tanacetum coccineum]
MGRMRTEMELALEQTQQGASYEARYALKRLMNEKEISCYMAYAVLYGIFGSEGYAYPVLCGSLDRRGEHSEAKDDNLRG